jgi:hypothetical protein
MKTLKDRHHPGSTTAGMQMDDDLMALSSCVTLRDGVYGPRSLAVLPRRSVMWERATSSVRATGLTVGRRS